MSAVDVPRRHLVGWRDGDAADTARHGTRTAALLGIALGASFSICFLTGLYSHLAQHPPAWFTLPASPSWLYRATQGLHVATGIATVPLLLAKLWAVYHRLFQWPLASSIPHALERISLYPLVAGGLYQVWSGVANIDLWYPWMYFWPASHYWVAWITMGALLVHVGAKWATTREVVLGAGPRRRVEPVDIVRERRRFLGLVGAGSGLLALTTVGQTVRSLKDVALLAPRRPDIGTQGFPVNGSAAEAGVLESGADPAYRLEVTGSVRQQLSLSLDELRALPQREAVLPITCVEGWSTVQRWRGVPVRDLIERAGAPGGAAVTVRSLQRGSLYSESDVNAVQVADPDTLIALEVNGEVLSPDHGFPCRLIGPNRPGVLQTKWLRELEVVA